MLATPIFCWLAAIQRKVGVVYRGQSSRPNFSFATAFSRGYSRLFDGKLFAESKELISLLKYAGYSAKLAFTCSSMAHMILSLVTF